MQAMSGSVTAGGRTIAEPLTPEHLAACRAGIARMYMKLGNTTKGIQMAIECGESVCVEVRPCRLPVYMLYARPVCASLCFVVFACT